MSTPKKPGTDLAALKARLAKKTKGADVPVDVPPPGQQAAPPPPAPEVPPPGEQYAPPPAPAAYIPAPGEVAPPPAPEPPPQSYAPPMDVPPPGQAYTPPPPEPAAPAMAASRSIGATDDDPFGGAMAGGGFDPNAGVIDSGGDVAPRGNKGLVVFAALMAAGLGGLGGYLGNNIVTKRAQVQTGKEKGEKMVAEVAQVSELRKTISLKMDEIKGQIATDPAAAGEALTNLLVESFDQHPKIDELFGWQLASIHKVGVQKTFTLYAEANRLQLELGILAGFLTKFADQLKAAGGPSLFGVTPKSNGVKLVTVLQPMCGEIPPEADEAALEAAKATFKPCEDAEAAVGFKVMDSLQSEPKVMFKGLGKDQVTIVVPDQDIYTYAVGMEPNKNALNQLDFQLTRISERLDAMNKAEKIALKALSKYAESPDVDGSTEQPDPGEGE